MSLGEAAAVDLISFLIGMYTGGDKGGTLSLILPIYPDCVPKVDLIEASVE